MKSPAPDAQAAFAEGLHHHQRGALELADRFYRRALVLEPGHFDALHLSGVIKAQQKQLEAALTWLTRALKRDPSSPSANQNLANVFSELKDQDRARVLFHRAITLNPGHADATLNLGRIQADQADPGAKIMLQRALTLAPESLAASQRLADLLVQDGAIQAGLGIWNHLLSRLQDPAPALEGRAELRLRLGQLQEALSDLRWLQALRPEDPRASTNRAQALLAINQLEAAEVEAIRAVRLAPRLGEARINLGGTRHRRHLPTLAERHYRQALCLDPASADGLRHLAALLQEEAQAETAMAWLRRAYRLNPNADHVAGHLLAGLSRLCDWRQFNEIRDHILKTPNLITSSLEDLLVFDDLRATLKRTRAYVSRLGGGSAAAPLARRPRGDKLRLGYFSSDFRAHPVAYNLISLLEHHDRDRFEIHGFDFAPKADDYTPTVRAALDHHHPVRDLDDAAIAGLSRRLGIDIAIDLNGHTALARTGIFLNRAAPVQINYLGYPGTMGTSVHDYLIADAFVIPEAFKPFYSEKVLWLPGFFMPYGFNKNPLPPQAARAHYRLPEDGIILASFNHSAKLTPDLFKAWMQILKATDQTVLWMAVSGGEGPRQRIREAVKAAGIDTERVIFADRTPSLEAHLGRLTLADLMLDSYPYNGHTTACDAINANLPILTRCGESFASRVVGSLLSTLGLESLITTGPSAYVERAVALANDPEALRTLKTQIAVAKGSGTLPDAKTYAQRFESLLLDVG